MTWALDHKRQPQGSRVSSQVMPGLSPCPGSRGSTLAAAAPCGPWPPLRPHTELLQKGAPLRDAETLRLPLRSPHQSTRGALNKQGAFGGSCVSVLAGLLLGFPRPGGEQDHGDTAIVPL